MLVTVVGAMKMVVPAHQGRPRASDYTQSATPPVSGWLGALRSPQAVLDRHALDESDDVGSRAGLAGEPAERDFRRQRSWNAARCRLLTVPTVTFDIVYVFFVLSLERRRVLHVNVTTHPHAAWAAQQMVEAIGADVVPVRLVRDRDAIFGTVFDARVNNLGIRQLRIAPRSPWQNGFAERWAGTLRRELLDHVIVLGERHLLRLVRHHVAYYNDDRPHMSLRGDAPTSRAVEPPSAGRVVALPRVGGLHHRYSRAA